MSSGRRPAWGRNSDAAWSRRTVATLVPAERAADALVGEDDLASECPLELRVHGRAWMVTLRTPGHDRELIFGLLRSEGVILDPADLLDLQFEETERGTRGRVELSDPALERWAGRQVRRELLMNSACGACGKATLQDLELPPGLPKVRVAATALGAERLASLVNDLRNHQPLFARTGGVHAAGWADDRGRCSLVREDVGRHNALDKTIGARLLAGEPVGPDDALVLSGRIGFELSQKAVMIGAGHLIAVGSATDAALELAQQFGVRLYWFVGGSHGGRRSTHVGGALSG